VWVVPIVGITEEFHWYTNADFWGQIIIGMSSMDSQPSLEHSEKFDEFFSSLQSIKMEEQP
jgi:hypothetical protein